MSANAGPAYGSGLPWGRLYGDWLQDYRVQSLSEALQRRHIALICLHIKGLTDPGDEEAAFHLRLTPAEWAETKRVFVEKGFLAEGSNHLVSWERRQYKSDTSTERVRKHRMKQRETVSVTAPETETETDSETEDSPPNPPDGGSGAAEPRSSLSPIGAMRRRSDGDAQASRPGRGFIAPSPADRPREEPDPDAEPVTRTRARDQARLLKQITRAYARALPDWPPLGCHSSALLRDLARNVAAHPERAAPAFWEELFRRAAASDWLNGPDFSSRSLGWLLKPSTADDLTGGRYQSRGRRQSGPAGAWEFLQTLNREGAGPPGPKALPPGSRS